MSPVQLFFLVILAALLLLIGFLLLISSSRRPNRTATTNTGARLDRGEKGRSHDEIPDRQDAKIDSHGESTNWSDERGLPDVSPIARRDADEGHYRERPPATAYSAERQGPRTAADGARVTEVRNSVERQDLDGRINDDASAALTLRTRSKLYHYTAKVISVYDGDTLTVDIDLGMDMHAKNQVIRLWKINTPEVRGPEREEGLEVRDLVRELVLGKSILLRTILDKRGRDQTGKYGRLLGEIILEDEDGLLNLNEYLLAKGLALPFGADGSAVSTPRPAHAPHPSAVPEIARGSAENRSENMDCPYCGQLRQIDYETEMVLSCSNCMDAPHELQI